MAGDEERREQRILLAPDHPRVAELLRAEGFVLEHQATAFDAMRRLQEGWIQAIVVGWDSPRSSGPTVVAAVAQDPGLRHVAVIALGEQGRAAPSALGLGADEFVVTEAEDLELVARVRGALARKRMIEELRTENAALRRQVIHLQDSSHTDSLTGLANRRHIESLFASLSSAARRHDWPLAIAILDIDRFKDVNDSFGHDHGDETIRLVSQRILRALRLEDHVGRWGGDEFVLVLPATEMKGAMAVAERVRSLVEAPAAASPSVTVSIGVAWGTDDTPTELLRRADVALYRSKLNGRNCVTAWDLEDQDLPSR